MWQLKSFFVGTTLNRTADEDRKIAPPTLAQLDTQYAFALFLSHRPLKRLRRADTVIQLQALRKHDLQAKDFSTFHPILDPALKRRFSLGDAEDRLHGGRCLRSDLCVRESNLKRRRNKPIRLVGLDAERTLFSSDHRGQAGRGLIRSIGSCRARELGRLQLQDRATANGQLAPVQCSSGDHDVGNIKRGYLLLAHGPML